jgi:hypothetical protein
MSGRIISGIGYFVSQSFAIGGNQAIFIFFWAVTGGPRYSGYKTLIVATEPSVEPVARAVHLMGCRIGTHMSLRVPPRDSVVRPWG